MTLPGWVLFNYTLLIYPEPLTQYGNLRICTIFERGADDYNLVHVLEQKRAKNSRFSVSIFRSRAKIARVSPIYI